MFYIIVIILGNNSLVVYETGIYNVDDSMLVSKLVILLSLLLLARLPDTPLDKRSCVQCMM